MSPFRTKLDALFRLPVFLCPPHTDARTGSRTSSDPSVFWPSQSASHSMRARAEGVTVMNASSPAPEEPLQHLPDEHLLDLARRAYALVIVRALGWLMPFVRGLAPPWFQEADIQDAQDSVLVDLMLALPTYDLNQGRTGQNSSFRTFAKNIVKRRFINILKRHRWVKEHKKSEEELQNALDQRADELDRGEEEITLTERGFTNPLLIAEVHERWERIKQVLLRLHPLAWRLWQEFCAGTKLSDAAGILGMNYEV